MKCSCGARGYCIDSRETVGNETRRRYECPKRKCGLRWTTYEIMAPNSRKDYEQIGPRKRLAGRVSKETLADIEKRVNELLQSYKGKK